MRSRVLVLVLIVFVLSLVFAGVVSAAGPYNRWLSPEAVIYTDPDTTADVVALPEILLPVTVNITTGWAEIISPPELKGFVETQFLLKDEPVELKVQRERAVWEAAQKVLNETKMGDLTWGQVKEMLKSAGVDIHEPVFVSSSSYVVVKGDNLTKIATKFGVSLKDLIAANNIANPNFIRPGDVLNIP